jgi:hypothetical protein
LKTFSTAMLVISTFCKLAWITLILPPNSASTNTAGLSLCKTSQDVPLCIFPAWLHSIHIDHNSLMAHLIAMMSAIYYLNMVMVPLV